ncbi:alkaline phosphatase domain-containing protein [Phthorimaea operculella]|nr:alkaline phosphatase domain-containing protein [Phthorimaea operculella]
MSASRVLVALLAIVCASADSDRYHPDSKEIPSARLIDKFNMAEQSADFWKNEAQAGIEKRVQELTNHKVARNVILFLGDGMSIPTLMAARTLKGQRHNRTGEESQLFFETFPTVGLSKTYCLNQQIPDSACTATAYLTGVKNNYGTIGVNGAVPRYDCLASMDKSTHLDSIAAWALEDGRDAGIVTNTRITHASPAGAYARVANRGWESDYDVVNAGYTTDMCPDIAHQLLYTSPGDKFKVILGGGRRNFLPRETIDEEGVAGRRIDGRNLVQEWKNIKQAQNVSYNYVWNRSELLSLRNSPPDYLLGLFESNHMRFNLETDPITEPTLAELTEIAINSLSRNEKGYFLFVESGRIDHAHHDNWPLLALDETLEFDAAIEKAVSMVSDDTLIVVTADHSHAMSVNGYSKRGNSITGASDTIADDGVPFMTISYTNGPGARVHKNGTRPDVTKEADFQKLRWNTHAEFLRDSETHGGDDVAVIAIGPHHHMFSGIYEESQIPWRMAYSACFGPGKHSEYCRSSAALHHPLSALYVLALSVVFRVLQR